MTAASAGRENMHRHRTNLFVDTTLIPAHVAERAGVEAWFFRQFKHPLGDDIALNLVGAPGDGNRRYRDQNFSDDSVARAFGSGQHCFRTSHQGMNAGAGACDVTGGQLSERTLRTLRTSLLLRGAGPASGPFGGFG